MRKGKKDIFRELSVSDFVIEHTDKDAVKQLRRKITQFNKIVLELACGRGEYTITLAKSNLKTLHIGVDIQGERLWYGVKTTQGLNPSLKNVLFLRAHIENLLDFFPKNSVDEIWITFPDPFPKDRHAKRRLTSQRFLEIYRQILQPNGTINLKTDSELLLNYTIESIEKYSGNILYKTEDLYANSTTFSSTKWSKLDIKTHFENKHLRAGKKIKYIKFTPCKKT